MTEGPPRLLRFYRADDLGVRGALVRGGASISLGALVMMLTALSHRIALADTTRIGMSFLGVSLLLFGLVTGFVMVPRLLFRESYVGIREDALLVVVDNAEEVIPWESIERIAVQDDVAIIRLREGEPRPLTRRYAGNTPRVLANLLDDARRKASLGLLRE